MTQLLLPIIVWQPMATAPRDCTWIIARNKRGNEYRVHYACGDGDGLMPPFDGFFEQMGSGRNQWFREVTGLVEWKHCPKYFKLYAQTK